jgi:crotonobetainyl-CoA:carnitine CoA-transferase CaiB-like acyl-CoA transferase
VKDADIFMANYEVEALKKFGLDFESLSRINPRLVYGVLTGYGQEGPDRKERGFDFTAGWARTGIQYLLADGDSPPPQNRPGAMDRVTGITVVAGLMAALMNREKTGKGRQVEFSLYHTGVWMEAVDLQMALTGNESLKNDRKSVISPLSNTYRTSDNRWIQLAMLQIHLHLADFLKAIGRPELAHDPRFPLGDLLAFIRNRHELIRILDEIFASQPLSYWEKTLKEHNCIFGRVYTPDEVIHDPQARINDFFLKIDHPKAGPTEIVNTPVKFTGDPVTVSGGAPEVGEHTEEVLLSYGYSWEDIAKLKGDGAII